MVRDQSALGFPCEPKGSLASLPKLLGISKVREAVLEACHRMNRPAGAQEDAAYCLIHLYSI